MYGLLLFVASDTILFPQCNISFTWLKLILQYNVCNISKYRESFTWIVNFMHTNFIQIFWCQEIMWRHTNVAISIRINVRENRRGNQEWTIQKLWATQDTGQRQTKQKTPHRKLKRWATRNPPKIEGKPRNYAVWLWYNFL